MAGRVIVVGSVNVDLVVSAPRLPRPGETVAGGTFARHHGGKGGNQAVAAARLAVSTSLIGAIGDDDHGATARDALASEGVVVDVLMTVPGAATGVAIIVVAPTGENQIAVAPGANASLDPPAVRSALGRLAPAAGDVVLVGHEIPTPAAREALRTARDRGAATLFNPAPAEALDRATFGLADVLTPNRRELAMLVAAEWRRLGRPGMPPADPAAAARTLVEPNAQGRGAGAVLVTLGEAGAVLVPSDGPTVDLPAPHVPAIDTVGAGDALNGALAAGLAGGSRLVDAARRAVVAGAISTTRPGARGGMPTAAELDAAQLME